MKRIFTIFISTLLLSSCNFLDFDESQGQTQEEAYSYFENITKLASAIYRKIPEDYGVMKNALRESATDNSVYTWDNNIIYNIYNDVWSPINTVDDQWSSYYQTIHDANSFLENYSEENLERFKWDPSYKDNIEKARMYYNEVTVLRALYYFELAKRYKDVPLLTTTVDMSQVNSVKKTDFNEIINFVVTECDAVADKLPINHNDFFGETGRVTKGAALAIKTRALLYAASPLFAGAGNSELWQKVAKAAHEVIELNVYSLPKISDDPLYNREGGNDVLSSPQLIFERRTSTSTSNSFEIQNLPINFIETEGAVATNSGNIPTQNLVDAYEMKTGIPFNWDSPEHVANIYYDANGNETRDPRLYLNVLCNGSVFMKSKIETFEGGKHGFPQEGASMTGYYLRKLLNESVTLTTVNPIKKPHHYPGYRYAEVLLSYAEAMNEWKGPEYTDSEHPLSAISALNQVRISADMPEVTTTNQEEFRKKVRNERRIELAFEDHRFWDIRRWKTGNLVEHIYGIRIENNNGSYSYKKELVQKRIWKDKMYLYPIPQNETYVNSNLKQNPGW